MGSETPYTKTWRPSMQPLLRIAVAAVCAVATVAALAASTAIAAVSGLEDSAGGLNLPAPIPHVNTPSGIEQVGSFNWSGYAQGAAAGTFFAVTDTWKVPTVNTSVPGTQYSSDWVGIGGLSDATLVQAGTEADNLSGTAFYRAWTEILPEPENPLSLVVHPGDKITTTVRETKPGIWTMTVADKTTKVKAVRTASYTGSSHASVETIHERPCIVAPCNTVSDLAELAQSTNVTFDPGKYATALKVGPKTPLLKLVSGATLDQLFMFNDASSAIIASPSRPDSDNDGFTVADGSVEPAPPKS